jgi:hypothetical protein
MGAWSLFDEGVKAGVILNWMQITVVIVGFSVLYNNITSGRPSFINFVLQQKTACVLGVVIISLWLCKHLNMDGTKYLQNSDT